MRSNSCNPQVSRTSDGGLVDPFHGAMERTLTRLRARTGIDLAFGGPLHLDHKVSLDYFSGPTIGALNALHLAPGEGLGGRAVVLGRGVSVRDYVTSPSITHEHDARIKAEGLRSMFAVPVIVRRKIVGVVYGAFRNGNRVDGRIWQVAIAEVRALEQTVLLSRDLNASAQFENVETRRLRERLRSTYDVIRELAENSSEPSTKSALQQLVDDIAAETLDCRPDSLPPLALTLTKREREVLQLVGRGYSNAMIAQSMNLTLYTVKSYMRKTMSKLSSRTRWEAFVIARESGLVT